MPYTPLDLSDIYKTSALRPLNPLQMQQAMMNKGKMARERQLQGIYAGYDPRNPLGAATELARRGDPAGGRSLLGLATDVQAEGRAATKFRQGQAKITSMNTIRTVWEKSGAPLDALIEAYTDAGHSEEANRISVQRNSALEAAAKRTDAENKRIDRGLEQMTEIHQQTFHILDSILQVQATQGDEEATRRLKTTLAVLGRQAEQMGLDPSVVDIDMSLSEVQEARDGLLLLGDHILPEGLDVFFDAEGIRVGPELTEEQKKSNAEARENQEAAMRMIANRGTEYRTAAEFVEAMLGDAGEGGPLVLGTVKPTESAIFKKVLGAALNFQFGDQNDAGYRYLLRLSTGYYGGRTVGERTEDPSFRDRPQDERPVEALTADVPGPPGTQGLGVPLSRIPSRIPAAQEALRAENQAALLEANRVPERRANLRSDRQQLLNPLELGPPVAPPQPAPVSPISMTAGPGLPPPQEPPAVAPTPGPQRTFTAADLDQDGLTHMQIREIVVGLRNAGDKQEYAQAMNRLQAGFREVLMQWQRSPEGLTTQKSGELKAMMGQSGLTSAEIEEVMSGF
jgi:hypothetical protein